MLIAGLEIRILSLDGTQLRRLTLDPTKDYQPIPLKTGVYDVPRHLSPMSRDITFVGEGGLEPPHPFGHRNLNPPRLPIPPLARVEESG